MLSRTIFLMSGNSGEFQGVGGRRDSGYSGDKGSRLYVVGSLTSQIRQTFVRCSFRAKMENGVIHVADCEGAAMILQALEHYEDLLKQGRIAKPGWGKVKSLWTESGSAGTRTRVDPVEGGAGDGRQQEKNGFVARMMEVPHPEKRSVAVCPNFVRQCDLYSWC